MMEKLILRFWHKFLHKIDVYENKQYRKTFGKFGEGSFIHHPLALSNTERIFVGKGVYVFNNARIQAVTRYAGQSYSPEIYIDDHVAVQQNLHLTCGEKIYIGKKVAITANVTITDIIHSYEDPTIPYRDQKLITKPVSIGEGSLITNGVVITPGSTIGKYCIVGSNSVVIGDIPDFSFAAGMPARVIKKYDFEKKTWEKVCV